MRSDIRRRSLRTLLLAGAAGLFAGPALANPVYALLTTIAIPAAASNTAGSFTSFDISYFDPSTQLDYVADRSNSSVDIFSAKTNSYVGRVGGFVGLAATTSVSGPDGVVVAVQGGQHSLYAGDGNSTLKGFDINNGYAPLVNTPLATGTPADKRVDEMAYSPQTNRLLVANNAAATPFATLIDTTNNTVVQRITFGGTGGVPNATNGIEQSVWDPNTGKFYLSIPQVGGTGPGAVAQIDPITGAVTKLFDLASFGIAGCGPSGLALGSGSQLLVGCATGGTQTVLFDPTLNGGQGGLVATFSQISGTDEVWFDPTTGRFFVSGANNPGGPVLGIIDGLTDTFLQNVATQPGNAHSVAVDPVSGEVFVPLPGGSGNTVCTSGCIGVYAVVDQTAVPEPGSLALLAGAMTTFGGMLRFRKRKTHVA